MQRQQQMRISAEQHRESMKQQTDLQKQQMDGMKEAFSKALKEAGIDPSKQKQPGQQTAVENATKQAEKLVYEESVKLDKLAMREDDLNQRVGDIDKRLDQLKKQEDMVKDMAKSQGQDPSKLDEVWRSIQKEGASLEQEKFKLTQELDSIAQERNGILNGEGIGKKLREDYQGSIKEKVDGLDKQIDSVQQKQDIMKQQSSKDLTPGAKAQKDKSFLELQREKVDLQIEKESLKKGFRPGSVGDTMQKQGYKFGQGPSIGTGMKVK